MTVLAQTGSAGSWPQTSGTECVCAGVWRLSGFWLELQVEACWNQGNISADAKCGHLKAAMSIFNDVNATKKIHYSLHFLAFSPCFL